MLVKIMQFYTPGFIKKKKLNELFFLTADAFKCDLPELRGLTFAACLSKYALFTKEQAENCLQSGLPIEEIKQRMYQNSYIFGQNLRKTLHIKTWEEAVTSIEAAYKLIRIDLKCNIQGEFTIRQCFFSKYYSEEVCTLVSSLDEGLMAGISGGGELCFYQRITEGCSCCKGYIKGVLK